MAVTINGNGIVTGLDSEGSSDLNTKLKDAGGLVMVAPTTIANSGGTATLTNGAVTFSGVSSVSLNGVFSAAYQWYKIMYYATASASIQNIDIRMRNAGTDDTSANYSTQYIDGSATTIAGARLTSQTRSNLGGIASGGSWGNIEIYNPFETLVTSWINNSGFANPVADVYTGQHAVASSFNGFTFLTGANQMTGTIRVYGYRNGV